jgi:hypothetical protein
MYINYEANIIIYMFSLSQNKSIYTAETYAIYEAVEIVFSLNLDKPSFPMILSVLSHKL